EVGRSAAAIDIRPRPPAVVAPLAAAPTLVPYTPLFRSWQRLDEAPAVGRVDGAIEIGARHPAVEAELEVALDAAGEQHRVLEDRSEEHTSELQSRFDIVCRLLLEKKNDIDPR